MGRAVPPRVTAQDFLLVPKSYPLRFLLPPRCLKSPCHANLLWESLWVSNGPLDHLINWENITKAPDYR